MLGFLTSTVEAADKLTLSGHIRDTSSSEELIGASIFAKSASVGTNTNGYGFYSLTLPPGVYIIRYSHVGYDVKEVTVALDKNVRLDVELVARPVVMDSVVVTAETGEQNTRPVEMSSLRIDPVQIRAVPVLFGEQDILKTIQLLPGVQEEGEGNAGFYVRGGSADQNLILLDEAIVYSSSHLLGFF